MHKSKKKHCVLFGPVRNILGKPILLETDHKPLVPLLGNKCFHHEFYVSTCDTKFQYSISHMPGKLLYMADTLSRAPIRSTDEINQTLKYLFSQSFQLRIPASKNYLDSYRTAQKQDLVCFKLIEFCNIGWPQRNQLNDNLNKYWQFYASLKTSFYLDQELSFPKPREQKPWKRYTRGTKGFRNADLE